MKPAHPSPQNPLFAPPALTEAESGTARPPTPARLRKEQHILGVAEAHFAQSGFEGASLEAIATAAGLSRHNLLYYFPSKEALYQRVLDDVLTQWLDGMQALPDSASPQQALREYIGLKMRSARERPNSTKVFAMEVMAGAPRLAATIQARVLPVLQRQVDAFECWATAGLIRRVDFTHLMFMLWSVTQAYAEHQAQFALLLQKPALEPLDYAQAEALLVHLVWAGLAPGAGLPPVQSESSGKTGRRTLAKGKRA
ncbi:MAG: TetR family transcriptional regulator C-terminal domain-containing protein [Comamonadaceae bacterium]|nr:TetR family transcriptional regulator C-terminal domain-containing protein [Comamonadaceae bacterium]